MEQLITKDSTSDRMWAVGILLASTALLIWVDKSYGWLLGLSLYNGSQIGVALGWCMSKPKKETVEQKQPPEDKSSQFLFYGLIGLGLVVLFVAMPKSFYAYLIMAFGLLFITTDYWEKNRGSKLRASVSAVIIACAGLVAIALFLVITQPDSISASRENLQEAGYTDVTYLNARESLNGFQFYIFSVQDNGAERRLMVDISTGEVTTTDWN